MIYYRITNLAKYQHYKDRRPPWVKLYQSALEDVDFTCLQDASKAHALLLLLVASRYDNHIPGDPKWLERALHATEPVDVDALVSAGFIERCACEQCASGVLASRQQDAMPRVQRTEHREQKAKAVAARATTTKDHPPKRESWITTAQALWAQYKGGSIAAGKLGALLKPLVTGWYGSEAEILEAWERYLTQHRNDRFASAGHFAEHYREYSCAPVVALGALTAPAVPPTMPREHARPGTAAFYAEQIRGGA